MIGKRKIARLAEITANLWMCRQPTETDTADFVAQINDVLGADFKDLVERNVLYIDPDFPVKGM